MYKLESIGHILEDIDKYGGKAIYLSKLIKNDFLVPPGFVISSDIFKDYKDSKLKTNFFERWWKEWIWVFYQQQSLYLQVLVPELE